MHALIGNTLFLASLVLLLLGVASTSHFPPWTSFHSEAPAFLASALLLLSCTVRGQVLLSAPVALALFLIGTAWLQVASGLVPFAGDAWVITAYLAAFAASWLYGASADTAQRRSHLLLAIHLVLFTTGLLAAFQCLAQWARVDDHWADWVFLAAHASRALGNYGQPNQTATLLLMAVAATAILLAQGRITRCAAWPSLLVMGWAVVITQSRTGLLSASVMVAAFLVLTLRAPLLRKFRKDALLWLALLFIGSWVLQAAPPQWSKGGIGSAAMVSVGLRPVLWKQLLLASLQQPWFGFGWLQVSTAQQIGALRVPGIEQTNYSHNILLDLVIMLGWPLAACIVLATAVWLMRRASRLDHFDGAVIGIPFVLLPLAVHTQLELPHAYAYFLVPAGLLLGVFDAATRGEREALAVPVSLVGALALGWAVLLGALGYEYAQAEEDFRINRFENRNLGTTPGGYEPPRLLMLTQLGDMLAAMRLRAGRAMPAEDLETLVRVSRRYTWAPLQFRTALALGLNGRAHEAEEQLRVIRDLFPKDVVQEGRENWERMARQEYPELDAVPFPSSR